MPLISSSTHPGTQTMPPKRKSLKRKQPAAVPSLPPPAKKQKLRAAPQERTTRSRSTRSGVKAEDPIDSVPKRTSPSYPVVQEKNKPLRVSGNTEEQAQNAQPAPIGNSIPSSPLLSQVSTLSSLSPVPEIHKAPSPAIPSAESIKEPDQAATAATVEGTRDAADIVAGAASEPDQALQHPQDAPQIKPLQDHPSPRGTEPRFNHQPPHTPPRMDTSATPVKRASSRRPPIFSEAMKRERAGREVERGGNGVGMDGGMVSGEAGEPIGGTSETTTSMHDTDIGVSAHAIAEARSASRDFPRLGRNAARKDLRQGFQDLRHALARSRDAVQRSSLRVSGPSRSLVPQTAPEKGPDYESVVRLFREEETKRATAILDAGSMGDGETSVATTSGYGVGRGQGDQEPDIAPSGLKSATPNAKKAAGRSSLAQPLPETLTSLSAGSNAELSRRTNASTGEPPKTATGGSSVQPWSNASASVPASQPSALNSQSSTLPSLAGIPKSAPGNVVPAKGKGKRQPIAAPAPFHRMPGPSVASAASSMGASSARGPHGTVHPATASLGTSLPMGSAPEVGNVTTSSLGRGQGATASGSASLSGLSAATVPSNLQSTARESTVSRVPGIPASTTVSGQAQTVGLPAAAKEPQPKVVLGSPLRATHDSSAVGGANGQSMPPPVSEGPIVKPSVAASASIPGSQVSATGPKPIVPPVAAAPRPMTPYELSQAKKREEHEQTRKREKEVRQKKREALQAKITLLEADIRALDKVDELREREAEEERKRAASAATLPTPQQTTNQQQTTPASAETAIAAEEKRLRLLAAQARAFADERTRVAAAAARAAAGERTPVAASVARRAEQERIVAVARAAEHERNAAAARAAHFKETLDTHWRELQAGTRSHSPYFPQFVGNGAAASQPTAGNLTGSSMAAPVTAKETAVFTSSTGPDMPRSHPASQPITGNSAGSSSVPANNEPRAVFTSSTGQGMFRSQPAVQSTMGNSARCLSASANYEARAAFTLSMDQHMAEVNSMLRLMPASSAGPRKVTHSPGDVFQPSPPTNGGEEVAPVASAASPAIGTQPGQVVTPQPPAVSPAPTYIAGASVASPSSASAKTTPGPTVTKRTPAASPAPKTLAERTITPQSSFASPAPTTLAGRSVTPSSAQRRGTTGAGFLNRNTLLSQSSSQPPAAVTPKVLVQQRPAPASQPTGRSYPSAVIRPPTASLRHDSKPSVLDTPGTGAMSPYGHSMADAPETSALLAELEAWSQSVGVGSSGLAGLGDFPGMSDLHGGSAGPSTSSLLSGLASAGGPSQHALPNIRAAMPGSFTQAVDKGKGKMRSPAKSKPPKPPVMTDKRPTLLRKKAPISVLERADRVRSQRMFMVHQTRDLDHLRATVHVLGSTGNHYTVEFGTLPTCNCPDYFKGNHCKHIIFVALKVLRMSERGTLWYQKGYTQAELRDIFLKAPPNAFNSAAAPANVQQAFREHVGLEPGPSTGNAASGGAGEAGRDEEGKRKPGKGDECPICADVMKDDGKYADELVYDLGPGGCGKGELMLLSLLLVVLTLRYLFSASQAVLPDVGSSRGMQYLLVRSALF